MVDDQFGDDDDEVDGGDCDFAAWAEEFRAAAMADGFAIFRDHLRRLGLPDKPLLLLEGTIHFVVMWSTFYSIDRAEGFRDLDLADMNEARWNEYRVAGYRGFDISHLDWSPLTEQERSELAEAVTNDLRYDYSEDELDIWVEDDSFDEFDETFLRVHVQERYDEDDNDNDRLGLDLVVERNGKQSRIEARSVEMLSPFPEGHLFSAAYLKWKAML